MDFLFWSKAKMAGSIIGLPEKILKRFSNLYNRVVYWLHVHFLVWYDRLATAPGKRVHGWLLHRKGIELIDAHTSHIGHAAAHTDYLLKKLVLERVETRVLLHVYPPARNNRRWRRDRYPNNYLQKLWQNHFGMMTGSVSHHVLHPVMWTEKGEPRGRGHRLGDDYPILSRKAGRQLQIPLGDMERGRKMLSELGVEPGAWFFCFYARDPFYKAEGSYNYRNCDIRALIPSVQYLTAAGGWGIRVGSPESSDFPAMDRVIDYPHCPYRSDFMDVFLAASNRFFLGSTGGICDLARCVFHAKTIFHNFIPLSQRHWKWLTDETVFIPKLLWLNESGRYMTFQELFDSGASEYFSSEQYSLAGISIHDNTPEDILALTEEVFLRKAGLWSPNEDDKRRQAEFRKLISKYCSYELADFRIGDGFLRKYES